jgi:branched-chain amino acid transport system ATP-binding protein
MALKVSQYAYVLETGKVGLEGPSADLMHNDHIRKLYLGG